MSTQASHTKMGRSLKRKYEDQYSEHAVWEHLGATPRLSDFRGSATMIEGSLQNEEAEIPHSGMI